MNATQKQIVSTANALRAMGEERCDIVVAGVKVRVFANSENTAPLNARTLLRVLRNAKIDFKILHERARNN